MAVGKDAMAADAAMNCNGNLSPLFSLNWLKYLLQA